MNKFIIGLLVLVAGVAVGWYLLMGNKPREESMTKQTQQGVQTTPSVSPAGGESMVPNATGTGEQLEKGGVKARVVVTYTDTGFAPNPVTVKAGTTVTFVNESSRTMWVASAVHPTHQLLPGFDQLKSVAKGATYEYTFTKVGTWKYHNHVNPTDTASVVVTQ